jgi:hypothetical protein
MCLPTARGSGTPFLGVMVDQIHHRTWAELGGRARAWRVMHATWSVVQLACLGLIWTRVVTRRRDPALWASVSFLLVEGGALVMGRGNCPMGRLQEEWGDPVPFFELLLPPRAAKAAIPVLAVLSVAAIAGVVFRRPGVVMRSPSATKA